MGRVRELAHDVDSHQQTVVTLQQPDHRITLVGERDPRPWSEPVPGLVQQGLPAGRIVLRLTPTQPKAEPPHVVSSQ
jgi:hypothetical protein